jgi:hypothetical protein
MDGSEAPASGRGANGRFLPGHGGRPFGARNRVSKRVTRAILRDFEANQDELLPILRRWHMPQYVALLSRLLPRQTEEGGLELETLSADELAQVLVEARAAMDRIEAGEGTPESWKRRCLARSGAKSTI